MTTLGQSVGISWQFHMAVRLLVSAGLGALIGLERERQGRSAGLRTHLLVALGAAVAMAVSLAFAEAYGRGWPAAIHVDPARVAYGVMGGIGFIGAGAIIHLGAGVRGLTTAASLWCAAAIGLATGMGMYGVAVVATALVLFALVVLDAVEVLIPATVTRRLSLACPDTSPEAPARYCVLLAEAGVTVRTVRSSCDLQAGQSVLVLQVAARNEALDEAVLHLRQSAPEILRITIE